MTDKLAVYNAALGAIGERKLASLAENREGRRKLDTAWDEDFIRQCLSMAQWKFATRTARLDYSPSIESDFGFSRAFDKQADWVRTCAVCSDEYYQSPLLDYKDEAGVLWASLDTIYVSFVSDDVQYGGDLSLWPANFSRYAALYLASQVGEGITQNDQKQLKTEAAAARQLKLAKSTDAMDGPTQMLPPGTWSSARLRGQHRDRGSRTRLIG